MHGRLKSTSIYFRFITLYISHLFVCLEMGDTVSAHPNTKKISQDDSSSSESEGESLFPDTKIAVDHLVKNVWVPLVQVYIQLLLYSFSTFYLFPQQ